MIFSCGKRIGLRPLEQKDLTAVQTWHNDQEVRAAQIGHPFPVTAEMSERWLATRLVGDAAALTAMVEEIETGAVLGYVQLTDIDWIARTARFGISLGARRFWGRGLGGEAASLLIDHAFSALNLERIHLEVPAFNERALRLYRRLGFAEEGRLRKHVFINGARHDMIAMGLLKAEWRHAQ